MLLPALNSASADHEIGDEVIHKNIYALVVKTSPPGLYIDGSGMYEKDSWAKTGTAPKQWGALEFVEWKVNDVWYPGNPPSIIMDKDHTAVAIYALHPLKKQGSGVGTYHNLTIISPYGKTTGSDDYLEGYTATFKVLEQYVYDEFRDGIRYAFSGWSDGNTKNLMDNSITMDKSKVITVSWTEQYRLDILNSIQEMDVISTGWHDKSSNASLIAISNFENEAEGGVKRAFEEWMSIGPNAAPIKDLKSPTTSVIMNKPYVIAADWKKQYYLDIDNKYGKVEGSGYYDAGTYATASIDSEIQNTGKDGTRLVFGGWYGDASSDGVNVKVLMDGPKSLEVEWKTQYYLTVNSEYGTPHGSDWYDEGQVATFGTNLPRDPVGLWKQRTFYGWDGSLKTTSMTGVVLMNGPKIVNAQWSEDYSIAFLNIGIIAGVIIGGSFAYRKMRKRTKSHKDSHDFF